MHETRLEKLYQIDYHSVILNASKQRWPEGSHFSCVGKPKKENLFLFLECSAKYTSKNGRVLYAKPGDIVYTPIGSEYSVDFFNSGNEKHNSVGLNFLLFDADFMPFRLSKHIKVYTFTDIDRLKKPFFDIAEDFSRPVHSPAKIKSRFYALLSYMSGVYRNIKLINPKFKIIEKGIQILERDSDNEISIEEIAAVCNVSEVYFRKLFREYSGCSPLEFRQNAIIEKAKQLILFTDKPISEISQMLGFSSVPYFHRSFKKKVGMTPKEFLDKNI